MSDAPVFDPVNNHPKNPFGLPLGSVRGLISVLICGFFWLVLLWPDAADRGDVKVPLGHYFLLALVLMAFASSPLTAAVGESRVLPWVLRILFAGGSAGLVVFLMFTDAGRLQRLTPDPGHFTYWFGPFLGVTAGGFFLGVLLRLVFGRENHIFQTMRAWLSLVGMLMMVVEFAMFIAFQSAENKQEDFQRVWQAIEIGVVSAYFGTRA